MATTSSAGAKPPDAVTKPPRADAKPPHVGAKQPKTASFIEISDDDDI